MLILLCLFDLNIAIKPTQITNILFEKKVGEYVINIVLEAKNCLKDSSKENGLTTGKVRSISSKLYRTLEDKSIDNVLAICERLLDEREWALGVIAYDWAYRVRKQYTHKTF